MSESIPPTSLTNRELYLLTDCMEWQSCEHLGCKARREIARLTRRVEELDRFNTGLATESERLRAALSHAMEQGGNPNHLAVRCFKCEEARELLSREPSAKMSDADVDRVYGAGACKRGSDQTSHEWLPNAVGSFTCDYCGSVATSNPAAPCTRRDSTLKAGD